MKIVELKINHKGWYDNLAAIDKARNLFAKVPYPECDHKNVTVSILKMDIDGKLFEARLSNLHENLPKEQVYYMLKSYIIELVHNELDKQAKVILGE